MNDLPDALTARLMVVLPFLPPQAIEVLIIVVNSLPRAIESGYGAINVSFKDHVAQVEVTSSYRVGDHVNKPVSRT